MRGVEADSNIFQREVVFFKHIHFSHGQSLSRSRCHLGKEAQVKWLVSQKKYNLKDVPNMFQNKVFTIFGAPSRSYNIQGAEVSHSLGPNCHERLHTICHCHFSLCEQNRDTKSPGGSFRTGV